MSKQYNIIEITDFINSIDYTNNEAIEKGKEEFKLIIRDIIEKKHNLSFRSR